MTKKMQARVYEACVESALLFDCATRMWRDLKKLQQFPDRRLRYIWSSKNEPLLREMQRKEVNTERVKGQDGEIEGREESMGENGTHHDS